MGRRRPVSLGDTQGGVREQDSDSMGLAPASTSEQTSRMLCIFYFFGYPAPNPLVCLATIFFLLCFSILVMTARATLNAPLQLFVPCVREAKCLSDHCQLLYGHMPGHWHSSHIDGHGATPLQPKNVAGNSGCGILWWCESSTISRGLAWKDRWLDVAREAEKLGYWMQQPSVCELCPLTDRRPRMSSLRLCWLNIVASPHCFAWDAPCPSSRMYLANQWLAGCH